MIKAETNENGEVNFEVTGRYCDIAKELVVVESHIDESEETI